MTNEETTFRIRPHHLFCILGFNGLGYSAEFVKEMTRIVEFLKTHPDSKITIVRGGDDICDSCPHHYRGRCTIDDPEDVPVDPDIPDPTIARDKRIASWLDLEEGSVQLWGQILYKVGRSIDSSTMDILCGDCRWRKFPHCETALNKLHEKVTNGELLFDNPPAEEAQ